MNPDNDLSRLISLLLVAGETLSQVKTGAPVDYDCSGSPDFYYVQNTSVSSKHCIKTIGGK